MPIEHISRLIGHKSTTVTKKVYRQQIRPATDVDATAMDRIFPELIEEPPSGSRARSTSEVSQAHSALTLPKI
ncbi:hypothetical protein GCM10023088_16480 [Actinomadura verrucosospora]|uniref:hypothetical protein n=1 Tax=Actinomadura verrucosospora TaxID=46165 RepID=UPI0031F14AD6